MYSKSNTRMFQAVIMVSFVTMIIVNLLASLLPLNGLTTAEISNQYPNPFTPAGITFLIWGFIYLLLAIYSVHMLIRIEHEQHSTPPELITITWLFIGSCVANSLWIFSWHYQKLFLSVIIMLVLLLLLIAIYKYIPTPQNNKQYIFIKLPFSIYLGWITVATIANITTYLVSINWIGSGLSAVIWTIIMLGIATFISIYLLLKHGDIAYSLVIIWAITGIIVKHIGILNSAFPSVIITALLGIVFIIAGIVYKLLKEKAVLR